VSAKAVRSKGPEHCLFAGDGIQRQRGAIRYLKEGRLTVKLIEAMKRIKELQQKADDIKKKVADNCALLSIETPVYGKDQITQITGWLQSCSDIRKEILRLRVAIQRTNLETKVEVDFGEPTGRVTKTLAEWIHRRRDLAKADETLWMSLTDRNLKEQRVSSGPAQPGTDITIIRFFNPVQRDQMIALYRAEPGIIDRTLEVTNAITDLIE
jgi:hypothetical protein